MSLLLKLSKDNFVREIKEAYYESSDFYAKAHATLTNAKTEGRPPTEEEMLVLTNELGQAIKEIGDVAAKGASLWGWLRQRRKAA